MKTNKLKVSADKYEDAKINWRIEYNKFVKTVEPLSDIEFWHMNQYLQEALKDRLNVNSPREAVKDACHELFRRAAVGVCAYSVINCVQFSNAWQEKRDQIYDKLDKIKDLGLGDDGFGDLCDALPIGGQELFTGLDACKTRKDLDKLIASKAPEWIKIINGENYFAMSLRDSGSFWMRDYVRNN